MSEVVVKENVQTLGTQHVEHTHVEHSHDEHHGHHELNFFEKYVFSQDHKIIARQFLITGMVWAFIGAMMSVIFRIQLAWPDESFPFLEQLVGKWAEGGKISPNYYYSLITMHGTILVFFVLTAGLSGTFANLLIPYQIGARDMASPFLNMLSYWFFLVSGLIMLSSLFIQTGAFAGGWTAYPPLSALPQASPGSGLGMTLWISSMSLFIISSLLGGLNYIATIINMRTKGMTFFRMPLTIWALFFTAILGVLSFPLLLASMILLLFDRHLGTSFYLSDIYVGGQALDHHGGSPILYQHLFWFLGHPEVYIILFPALGMVSEILAVNSRKPFFGYRASVVALGAICVIGFFVWAHHMFISGINPFIASIFVLTTLAIAIPSAVKVFNFLATIWRGNIQFTPAMMFSLGFVSLFISGGLTGIFLGNSALDIPLHDTYFVVAHFHIVMGVASFFGLFAGVYHWFPKLFNGRMMDETLGKLHFWITLVGAYSIFWPMHYIGLTGVPRRYYSFNEIPTFADFSAFNIFITIAATVVFLAQMLFVYNLVNSIFRGRKMDASLNPWKSTTLEWTTPMVPEHGNWVGEIPHVHRWAYDYSRPDQTDGRDFIPQNEPLKPGEKEGEDLLQH